MGLRNLFSFCPPMTFRNMFQGRENEVELGGRYTIKSHGGQLARSHKHDWLILILLAVIEIVLNIIHPFYRFVGKDMMTDLKYPMKENTVPVWSVPLYAVLLPIAVFVFFYLRRGDVHDLHHSILGLLFAVLLTGVLTDAIKDAVGRPRPDFFWRCFPDGKDAYDQWGDVICHGKDSDIKEGHKSFPSGHTSWSFAGLSFLSLYLAGKIKCFDAKGHVAKLCLIFLPLLAACLVGISRVDDYWHHWQDVFAGGLLGLTVATFCYLQFFPPPYHSEGWGPYAYFRAMEEARSTVQPDNGISMEGVQQTATNSNGFDHSLESSFDAMESGRRGAGNQIATSEDQSKSLDSASAFSTKNVFKSKVELIAWAKETGNKLGYVIIISSSQPQNGGRKARCRFRCERGGKYKIPKNITNTEVSRNGTGTKRIECPFQLHGVKLDNDDDWVAKIICASHNHPHSQHFEGHSFLGRLNKEEETLLLDMMENMIRPRNILMTMKKKNVENVSTMKTIYNARQKQKIIEKAGRSQMQQLMKKLNECGYVEWHRSNDLTDCIKDLFWAHPLSVEALHAFPLVLIMDCTYKTNRYGLPLLEVVGVTCTHLTFSVAFVYMEAEREENYTWAMEKLKGLLPSNILPNVILTDRDLALMNSIKIVFPSTTNLLCRFHISRNVLANSRKLFECSQNCIDIQILNCMVLQRKIMY